MTEKLSTSLKYGFDDKRFLEYLDIISEKVDKSNDLKSQLDFNIFSLVSEKYQLENLHSDIISKLLDPHGGHKEGRKFLDIFIQALTQKSPSLLSMDDFNSAMVKREKNRIDISIIDEVSASAIIIENKINGAIDQDRQLQRYYQELENAGLSIKAVVYLTLHGENEPDTKNWETEYVNKINRKLVRLPAYHYNAGDSTERRDLLGLWIERCAKEAAKENNREIFNQYKNLIIKIASKMENQFASNHMYDILSKDQELLKKSFDLYTAMESFPNYLAHKIGDRIPELIVNGNSANLQNFKFDDTIIVCVVCIEIKDKKKFTYKLRVWDINYEINGTRKVIDFLGSLVKELELKDEGDSELSKNFLFPEGEIALYQSLEKIVERKKNLAK